MTTILSHNAPRRAGVPVSAGDSSPSVQSHTQPSGQASRSDATAAKATVRPDASGGDKDRFGPTTQAKLRADLMGTAKRTTARHDVPQAPNGLRELLQNNARTQAMHTAMTRATAGDASRSDGTSGVTPAPGAWGSGTSRQDMAQARGFAGTTDVPAEIGTSVAPTPATEMSPEQAMQELKDMGGKDIDDIKDEMGVPRNKDLTKDQMAEAASKYPVIYDELEDGKVNLYNPVNGVSYAYDKVKENDADGLPNANVIDPMNNVPLDPRTAVGVARHAKWASDQGVTLVRHGGFKGDSDHGDGNEHNLGMAVDIRGYDGVNENGEPFSYQVSDWGKDLRNQMVKVEGYSELVDAQMAKEQKTYDQAIKEGADPETLREPNRWRAETTVIKDLTSKARKGTLSDEEKEVWDRVCQVNDDYTLQTSGMPAEEQVFLQGAQENLQGEFSLVVDPDRDSPSEAFRHWDHFHVNVKKP